MLISSSSSGESCPCKASFHVSCGICASFTMAMGHCSRQKRQKPTPSVLRKWALLQTLCTTDCVGLVHPLPPVLQQQQAQQQQQQQHRAERIWADTAIITTTPTMCRVTTQMCAQRTIACYRLSTFCLPAQRSLCRWAYVYEEVSMVADPERFKAAIARFDAANAEDPTTEVFQGVVHPKELL